MLERLGRGRNVKDIGGNGGSPIATDGTAFLLKSMNPFSRAVSTHTREAQAQ